MKRVQWPRTSTSWDSPLLSRAGWQLRNTFLIMARNSFSITFTYWAQLPSETSLIPRLRVIGESHRGLLASTMPTCGLHIRGYESYTTTSNSASAQSILPSERALARQHSSEYAAPKHISRMVEQNPMSFHPCCFLTLSHSHPKLVQVPFPPSLK